MLPAFPEMAADLTPLDPNRVQLAISAFMFGMGTGTFIVGPISDTVGRKPIVIAGAGLFVLGCAIAHQADSLDMLLFGRLLQGIGAAGPRIGPMAMIRDLYSGRRMAQLSSIIMAVFMLFPAVAPYMGALIIKIWDWHALFVAFSLFSIAGAAWLTIRQPETLLPEHRRSLHPYELTMAAREVLGNRLVLFFTIAVALGFGGILALISSIQLIYDQTFGRAESFPAWFALGALIAAIGTILNASLVMRVGMRRLVLISFSVQIFLALVYAVTFYFDVLSQPFDFVAWFFWTTSVFFMAGFIFGNLNALAMQPMGHLAGMASSLIAGVSTVLASLLSVPVSLAFDGTPVPLALGSALFSALAAYLVWTLRHVELDEHT